MLKKLINEHILNNIDEKDSIAILFSGGLDSLSILLSCIDIGVTPNLYTFYLQGYESDDLIYSRKIAQIYNLKLTEIEIPYDIDKLICDVEYIVNKFKTYRKTSVQCIHPFIYVIKSITEDYVLSGLCADELYGTSKHMSIISKDNCAFYEERRKIIKDKKSSSYIYIKTLVESNGHKFIAPYKESDEIIEFMLSKSYKDMNSPKQKNIMYISYKDEIDANSLYRKNSNLQCCSRIREYHDLLLTTKLNKNGYKIVTPIYKRMLVQE